MSAARATTSLFRPDIEGIRAIAVVAVLLFHVQVPAFGGGFTGVDVFNVISGFLITGLLVREVDAGGHVDLPRFYFRRARRLLPAGLLVILVTLVASAMILSPIRFPSVAGDGAASALYVANYRFALAGTDYLAAAADPSPYQHFWSLAVEEQFYLVWPLLILFAARLVGARRVGFVLAGVSLVSFLFSLYMTDISAPWAFFSLPTRAWELGVGGLVAIGIAGRLPARMLPFVGALGLALVVGGVLFINDSTPYPGTAALMPVIGTALLIIGASDASGRLAQSLGSRVPRFLGGISYSLYLWHWPLLILVPIALSNDTLTLRVILGAVSIAFAIVSTHFIEAPFRFGSIAKVPAMRGVTVGLAASILVGTTAIAVGHLAPDPFGTDDGPTVAVATPRPRPTRRPTPVPLLTFASTPIPTSTLAPATQPPATEPPATDVPATQPPATEPPATDVPATPAPSAVASAPARPTLVPSASVAPIPTPRPSLPPIPDPVTAGPVPKGLTPRLKDVQDDLPKSYADGCHLGFDAEQSGDCVYGDETATTTVVLFGDSHAAQWLPVIEDLAFVRGWRVISLTKSACPPVDVPVWNGTRKREYRECDAWHANALDRIDAEHPAIVFVAGYRLYDYFEGDRRTSVADDPTAWSASLGRMIERLSGSTDHVVSIADTPLLSVTPDECLASKRDAVEKCEQSRADVVDTDYAALEHAVAASTGAQLISMTDVLCPGSTCPLIFGTTPVYRDDQHLTATFAQSLTTSFDLSLDQEDP